MLSSSTATTIENTYPRRRRHNFTKAQLNKLEATFNNNDGYIDPPAKDDLAQELDLDEAHVRIWFQNRRAKVKRQIKPTLSSFAHAIQPSEIRDAVAQTPAMETTGAKQTTGNRQLFDLSNIPPEQSIINTGNCLELRKELQSGLLSNLCYKPCHTTKIRKPEADSLSSVLVSLDGRSESTCKGSASDVNYTGLLGEPKLDKVSNQISAEAPNTGIADTQVSSPLMVYNVQTFSPTAVPRVLPVKENPRDHYDGSHVKKATTPHLLHERPSTKLRRILPKSAVSPSLSERQGQGHPQDGDGCSNVPSSNEQLRSHSESIGMCLPHVPVPTQLPSKSSMVDRTQETVVPDKDTLVHEGLPGEITCEPKEHDSSLTNYSRLEVISVDTDEPKEHDSSLTNYSRQEVTCVDTDEPKEHDSSLTNYSRLEVSSVDTYEPKEHDSSLTNYSRQEVTCVDTDEPKEHDSSLTNYSRLEVISVDTDEPKEHDSSLTNYSRLEVTCVDTDEPKEHDSSLTNYSRQEVSSVDTDEPKEHDSSLTNYSRLEVSSVDTDDSHTQLPALNRDSFFSAMCEIDTDWTPLPDDVAVMFNSYRESPDCSGGVDITDAAESEATVVEKNVHLPILLC